jgi:hypothetical protein
MAVYKQGGIMKTKCVVFLSLVLLAFSGQNAFGRYINHLTMMIESDDVVYDKGVITFSLGKSERFTKKIAAGESTLFRLNTANNVLDVIELHDGNTKIRLKLIEDAVKKYREIIDRHGSMVDSVYEFSFYHYK